MTSWNFKHDIPSKTETERTKAALGQIPENTSAILLIRHGERPRIEKREDNPLLTEFGIESATKLGKYLHEAGYVPGFLGHSPIQRCKQTLEAICQGACWSLQDAAVCLEISHDSHIIFSNFGKALEYILRKGPIVFAHEWSANNVDPAESGVNRCTSVFEQFEKFLAGILEQQTDRPTLSVLATHDIILMPLISHFLTKEDLRKDGWPGFLEGLVFWKSNGKLVMARGNNLGSGSSPAYRT